MTQPTETDSEKGVGPLPLLLGVTGHRNLRPEDVGALEARVRGICEDIQRQHPHTRLYLLSPLADGADRLAARVALAMGVRLIVPLPMPKALYEEDFKAPGSLAEFHELLASARQSFELPILPGHSESDIRMHGEARNQQYALAGSFVARHCQVLIALWDGQRSEKVGGTAQIVKFKLQGVPFPYAPKRNPLDPAEGGPVYHVVTPRVSDPTPEDALALKKLYPPVYHSDPIINDLRATWSFTGIFRRMEVFNQDAVRLAARQELRRQESKRHLVSEPEDEAKLSESTKHILRWYGIADSMALYFQRQDLWVLRVLTVLGVATALFLQLSSGDTPSGWYFCYLACLIVAYAVFATAWWKGHHSKALDYRALAEGLRVQIFWRMSGLYHTVSDFYLRKQRGELDWIRCALRTRNILITSEGMFYATTPQPDRLDVVFRCWIKDQAKYFRKKGWDFYLKNMLFWWVGLALFLLPLVLSVIKAFLETGHLLIIGIGLSLAVAASLPVYAKVRGYHEHAKQFWRMHVFFSNADGCVQESLQAGNYSDVQGLIFELGKEALTENGDWVMLHRERAPEVKG